MKVFYYYLLFIFYIILVYDFILLTFGLTLAEVKFGCLIYLNHIILLSLRRTRTRVETS